MVFEICDFEHQLLRQLCDMDAPRAPTCWGAGVGVAIEALHGAGYVRRVPRNGGIAYEPTDRGRERAVAPLENVN